MDSARALADFASASKSDLATLLMAASRAVNERALARLDPDGSLGIRLAHVPVIAALDADGVRMGEIARRIGVTRQAAAALCKDLDAAGIVQCSPDPSDARAVVVTLTAAGVALCEAAADAMRALEREFADVLGLERFDQVLAALHQLIEQRQA